MQYHVGDFILRIKNAYQARKREVKMPYSNINKAVAKLLVKEGYIAQVEETEIDGKRMLVATLRYENRKAAINEVRLISKPSIRVYVDTQALHADKDTSMTAIISTSSGIMTAKEAMKKGVGGELLFKVW